MEVPKQKTPEEIAEIEKSRTISDAELLKSGAIEKEGAIILSPDQFYGISEINFKREMFGDALDDLRKFCSSERTRGQIKDFLNNKITPKVLQRFEAWRVADEKRERSGEKRPFHFDSCWFMNPLCASCTIGALEELGEKELSDKVSSAYFFNVKESGKKDAILEKLSEEYISLGSREIWTDTHLRATRKQYRKLEDELAEINQKRKENRMADEQRRKELDEELV